METPAHLLAVIKINKEAMTHLGWGDNRGGFTVMRKHVIR